MRFSITQERSKNTQLAINMIASVFAFAVSLGIKFFLAPFVVKSLGVEAYGFVGLSTDIISYTSIITIALNSMAGRFITIEYTKGNKEKASRYFSSVFYSNIILALVILFLAVFFVIWLEYFFSVPNDLLFDVKILFSVLVVNNIIGLLSVTWGVSTFIKNRVDLSSICSCLGNVIQALMLILLFSFFIPHIWYIGVTACTVTLFTTSVNYGLSRRLTPELKLRRQLFDWALIKELISSGIWNVLNKVGDVLGYGLNLLLANLFMGATAMGVFALTKNIPIILLSLFQTIALVFAPMLTQLYAQNKKEEIAHELNKSIRILGFITTIPLSFLIVWGMDFYSLWLPTQDARLLQLITVLGIFDYVVSMPIQPLWNIFTITNKLKYSSISLLISSVLIIVIILISMFVSESQTFRLCMLAASAAIVSLIRSLLFLPQYGAYCLSLPRYIFYKPIFRIIICSIIAICLTWLLRFVWTADSWINLVIAALFTLGICCTISYFFILTKSDRVFIINKFLRKK